VRALVVDDEAPARARLRRLLADHTDVEIVGEASHGQEAIDRIAELAPDLVLLDIEMPVLDGLSVAESAGDALVVFTTSHTRYGVDAFEADALDYLIKPISRERLGRALAKVRAQLAARERARHVATSVPSEGSVPGPSAAPAAPAPAPASTEPAAPWRLVVTDGPKKRFVDAREVDCFASDQKYVAFRVGDDQLLLRDSLDSLEQRLASLGFVRANRGALVRIGAVEVFDASEGGSLVLRDGTRIPVSRRAIAAVRAALGLP
jgi:two-component system LytT family response regulator